MWFSQWCLWKCCVIWCLMWYDWFVHICTKTLYLTMTVTGVERWDWKDMKERKEWEMVRGCWVYIWAVRYEKDCSNMCDTQFPPILPWLLPKLEVKQSNWGQCISPLQADSRIQACFSCLIGFLAETYIRFKVYPSKVLKLCLLALKCVSPPVVQYNQPTLPLI